MPTQAAAVRDPTYYSQGLERDRELYTKLNDVATDVSAAQGPVLRARVLRVTALRKSPLVKKIHLCRVLENSRTTGVEKMLNKERSSPQFSY